MVRKERLELSHLTILVPKTSASTNSATLAHLNLISAVSEVALDETGYIQPKTAN